MSEKPQRNGSYLDLPECPYELKGRDAASTNFSNISTRQQFLHQAE